MKANRREALLAYPRHWRCFALGTVLANGGVSREPMPVLRIQAANGRVLCARQRGEGQCVLIRGTVTWVTGALLVPGCYVSPR